MLQRKCEVTFNSKDKSISFSFMSFEFIGYLCSHALKDPDIWNIKVVLSYHILNRYTKHAREGRVLDNGSIVNEDLRQIVSN